MADYLGRFASPLCSKPLRSWLLTGFFRECLTRLFYSAENIEEPDLRTLLWTPGTDTKILIEADTLWAPQLTQLRPGVIIKRNGYKNMLMAIGDLMQGPDTQGDYHHETFWVGSHTLFAIGGSGMQAELLGSEVQRYFTEFALYLAKDVGLTRLQVTELDAPAKLEESNENWVVPVTVGYTFSEAWKVSLQAPRLKAVVISS